MKLAAFIYIIIIPYINCFYFFYEKVMPVAIVSGVRAQHKDKIKALRGKLTFVYRYSPAKMGELIARSDEEDCWSSLEMKIKKKLK